MKVARATPHALPCPTALLSVLRDTVEDWVLVYGSSDFHYYGSGSCSAVCAAGWYSSGTPSATCGSNAMWSYSGDCIEGVLNGFLWGRGRGKGEGEGDGDGVCCAQALPVISTDQPEY